jgi:hypothetical protein
MLIYRGGGVVCDDVLKIRLQDANYAKTGGYPADDLMIWIA